MQQLVRARVRPHAGHHRPVVWWNGQVGKWQPLALGIVCGHEGRGCCQARHRRRSGPRAGPRCWATMPTRPTCIRSSYGAGRCGAADSPPRWTAMLQVQALSVEVGGRQIIANASFTVMPRDKVGLVGRNGAGKTTLFRVLGGRSGADGRQGVAQRWVRLPAAGSAHRRCARRPHSHHPRAVVAAASTRN